MFKTKNRLTKEKEISFVFKNGLAFYYENLGVKVVFLKRDFSRFGFLLSKKVSKKAVVRNTLKRRIRAITKVKLPLLRSCDLLFVCQPGLEKLDYQQLETSIDIIFKKLKIYQDV